MRRVSLGCDGNDFIGILLLIYHQVARLYLYIFILYTFQYNILVYNIYTYLYTFGLYICVLRRCHDFILNAICIIILLLSLYYDTDALARNTDGIARYNKRTVEAPCEFGFQETITRLVLNTVLHIGLGF